ncbi:HU family DNA-binding protein [Aquicoccus sp. SU-CL01552]|uniref:HU family DNA-binding protein n=1 Tax=Aquicoccus sp. SU-CL01552 TaxID=3127656 RepID=UPI003105EE6C
MADDEHSETVPTGNDSKGTTPDVAPQSAPVEPHVLRVSEPEVARPDLRKKELIDAVLERCEVKKRDAKPVIEAMLAVLGETLAGGRGLNLEPLGKLRVNRTMDRKDRRIVVSKLRQKLQSSEDTTDTPAQEPDQDA